MCAVEFMCPSECMTNNNLRMPCTHTHSHNHLRQDHYLPPPLVHAGLSPFPSLSSQLPQLDDDYDLSDFDMDEEEGGGEREEL